MNESLFSISVEAQSVIDAIGRVGTRAPAEVRAAAKETAIQVVEEARRRVSRATGETADAIYWDLNYRGTGYVVLMSDIVFAAEQKRRERLGLKSRKSTYFQEKHTGLWLEYGTTRMRRRPFFFSAADVEAGGHLRRVERALQSVIDEVWH